jgi:hypothetical protein
MLCGYEDAYLSCRLAVLELGVDVEQHLDRR